MDQHIHDYYSKASNDSPQGNFYHSIALHEAPDIDWGRICEGVHNLPRGWYELSQLSQKDRLEFLHDYWQSKLPYRDKFTPFIDRFFSVLDDIGIFITQKHFDDPFEAEIVYSMKEGKGFYRGKPPIQESDIEKLKDNFPGVTFPPDYIAFLQIHDGFCKATDTTGITSSKDMLQSYNAFQAMMQMRDMLVSSQGQSIDPKTLIPFYESFGMPFYQCFWTDWYPEQEMGNVYYSAESNSISDVFQKGGSTQTMAFTTFLDWLGFYMESII